MALIWLPTTYTHNKEAVLGQVASDTSVQPSLSSTAQHIDELPIQLTVDVLYMQMQIMIMRTCKIHHIICHLITLKFLHGIYHDSGHYSTS